MTAKDNALEPVWLDYLPSFIQSKLKSRQNLQKIVANMGWLMFDKILRMGVGLLVGVWVARYLGPGQFGTINYATAFVGMFGGFTTLGLDSIVVRELVNRSAERSTILGTSFVLKLAASSISSFIAVVSIYFIKNDGLTRVAVAIIAGTMIAQSFEVVRFWFESQVKSKYVVISQNSAFLIMTVVKVVLLVHKASLIWFVWVILFESILASVGFLVFYRMRGEKMGRWNFQTAEAKALLHNSWPLILSGLAIFVYMRISQVMLGSMLNEISVGIYAAALRISEIWYFIPSILLTSVYPRFVQMYIDDESEYTAKLTSIMSVFFWGSLLVAILVLFLSGRVINMLYGAAYSASANVLSVHIFTGVLVNMGVIFSQRYILKNQQKYFLWGTVFGAVVNVVFNLLLIPHYGAVGSAIATLFSQIGAPLFIAILFDRSVGRIYLNAVLWPVRLIYASK